MLRLMCEESVTRTVKLLFSLYTPFVEIPTCVLMLESGLTMKPAPVSVRV